MLGAVITLLAKRSSKRAARPGGPFQAGLQASADFGISRAAKGYAQRSPY